LEPYIVPGVFLCTNTLLLALIHLRRPRSAAKAICEVAKQCPDASVEDIGQAIEKAGRSTPFPSKPGS
jgi:hypothetical protein